MASKKPVAPTQDHLLAALETALREAPTGAENGLTSTELEDRLGSAKQAIHKILHRWKREGILRSGKSFREALDGRLRPHTVYWLDGKEKGGRE